MKREHVLTFLAFASLLASCAQPAATPTFTLTQVPTATLAAPTAAPPTSTPAPAATTTLEADPFSPLAGSGDVKRTMLTYDDLMNGSDPTSPVDDGAFALPTDAAQPEHTFEGRLELIGEATSGGSRELVDNLDWPDGTRHIPEFDFEFVQHGSHLIPLRRGLIVTHHPSWFYILEPGRVWKEKSDQGSSRASFPFALVGKLSGFIHNGVMTLLFNNDEVSKVWYQITQETCPRLKFDAWGLLEARYHASPAANADQVRATHEQEVKNRFPTKPIEQLAADYPGTDLSKFGDDSPSADTTTYGFVIGGVNYVGGCRTRYGDYAYCDHMRLTSQSTAKSAFAAVALMRLAQEYGPEVADLLIKDYVPEFADSPGDWRDVTFHHTLDMATGNYQSSEPFVDEGNYEALKAFFDAASYVDKIAAALNWPHSAAPGTQFVYNTPNTFVLTRAMHDYLQSQEGPDADVFQFLVDEVYVPIRIGPGMHKTIRTSDSNWQGQAMGAWGLLWIQDDIAKMATLLNSDGGAASGVQILHPGLLAGAMQQDPSDRGMEADIPGVGHKVQYNNGFWALAFTPAHGYDCSFWVPSMWGGGGIEIVMMPNGSTYYEISDHGRSFDWADAVAESNKIRPHCQCTALAGNDAR